MTEMVTSGSMSGARKRSDGLLGESDHERRRLRQAPPVLHATALFAALTLSFSRVVMKSVRLAITRCPARAVRTYTLRGVEHWRGGVQVYLGRLRRFQLRARVGSTITPSPMPPHQTGRDHFGHPASRPCSPRGVRKRCTTVPWSW